VSLSGTRPRRVVGSLLSGRIRACHGEASAVVGGLTLFGAAALIIPSVPANAAVAVPLLVVSAFLMS
jgi:hypothetical protein